MFFNYRNGLYHLTYSIDDTGSENYRVGYATATSMNGPWTYRGVILEKDLSLGIKGTGHSSIINVPGTDDWYIAYHRFAIPGGNGNNRETTIDRIEFGADGLMQKVTPTLESVSAQLIVLGPDVQVGTTARCIAGKVTLVVQVKNLNDAPITANVSTPVRHEGDLGCAARRYDVVGDQHARRRGAARVGIRHGDGHQRSLMSAPRRSAPRTAPSAAADLAPDADERGEPRPSGWCSPRFACAVRRSCAGLMSTRRSWMPAPATISRTCAGPQVDPCGGPVRAVRIACRPVRRATHAAG